MLQKAIIATVDVCIRYAVQVIVFAAIFGLVGGIYAASHFALDANANNLVSKDLPWRQRELAYEAAFTHGTEHFPNASHASDQGAGDR